MPVADAAEGRGRRTSRAPDRSARCWRRTSHDQPAAAVPPPWPVGASLLEPVEMRVERRILAGRRVVRC